MIHNKTATKCVNKIMSLYEEVKLLRAQILNTLTRKPFDTHVTLAEYGSGLKMTINDPLGLIDASGIQHVGRTLKRIFSEYGTSTVFASQLLKTRRGSVAPYPKRWIKLREEATRAYAKLYNKIMK
jgi:hypothetical protein